MIKKLLTSLFLILGNYLTAQIPEDGLIAYYPLNGIYNDASGNDYHLSATGPVPNPLYTVGRTGAVDGSALSIPFRKLFHEYSSTDYSAFQNQSFTMGIWTRNGTFDGELTSVMSLGNEIFIRFWLSSGILRLQAGYLNHTVGSYITIMSDQLNTFDTPWASGSWRFLSVTRDAATNTMTLRINNSVVATSTSVSDPVVYSNSLDRLYIGSGGDHSFNGRIQDAFYYNRSLSASEIAALVCNVPHPEVTVSAPSICSGSSATINTNGTNPQNTHWYSSSLGSSSHLFSDIEYITPNLTENTTYYIENEAANGCRSYPRVPATVNMSTSPVNTTSSQNLSVCKGTGTSLSVSGTNVVWYDAEMNGNVISNGNSYTIASLVTDTVFYAESDESVLCGLPRTAVAVSVYTFDVPQNTTAPANMITCSNAVLSVSGTGTIQWFNSPVTPIVIHTGANYTTPVLSSDTTYYVRQYQGSCYSERIPITVTFGSTPEPVLTSPAENQTVCQGTTTTLSVSGIGIYQWFNSPTLPTVIHTGSNFTTPTLNNNVTYYVRQYTQHSGGDCYSSRLAVPIVVSTINTTVAASGSTLTSNQVGAAYQWIDCNNGNTIISGETAQSFTALSSGNYAVEVTINGCTKTSDCVAVNFVGIEASVKEDWSIYPNPATDKLFIELNQSVLIEIVDVFGKTVRNEHLKSGNNIIDVSSLTSGVYFIKSQTTSIDSEHSGTYLKFVKK